MCSLKVSRAPIFTRSAVRAPLVEKNLRYLQPRSPQPLVTGPGPLHTTACVTIASAGHGERMAGVETRLDHIERHLQVPESE